MYLHIRISKYTKPRFSGISGACPQSYPLHMLLHVDPKGLQSSWLSRLVHLSPEKLQEWGNFSQLPHVVCPKIGYIMIVTIHRS